MTQSPADRSPFAAPILATLAALVATIVLFTGENAVTVVSLLVFEGPYALAAVGAATLAGLAVSRRVVPTAPRSLLIAGGGAVGLGAMAAVILCLGLVGALNFATSWAIVAAFGVLGAIDLALDRRRWMAPLDPAGRWLWPLAGVAFGMVAVAASMPAGAMWAGEPNAYDVASYHLPVPRAWFEMGRIAPLDFNVFSRFPMATEALFLLQMHARGGAYEAAYAAQFANGLIVLLLGVGTFGAARSLGANALAATASAVVAVCTPWSIMLGSIAYNEPLMMLAAVATAGLLFRAIDGGWRPALLAGLCAGAGIAAKYPAVPMLAGAGGLGLLVALLAAKRPPKAIFGVLLAFAIGAIVLPAPWLIRNVAWYGNPVSPLASGLFGGVAGWSPEQAERWNAAHSLDVSHAPRQVLSELVANPSYGWLLLPAALACVAIGLSKRRPAAWLLFAWAVASLLVWLTATHMIGRFLVFWIGPAAAALALLGDRREIIRAAGLGLAGLGLLATALFVGTMENRVGLWQQTRFARGELSLLGTGAPIFLAPDVFLDADGLPRDPAFLKGRDVYLVGAADAWTYPADANRLHYKNVFDVPPADDALVAWLGDAIETADDDALVIFAAPGEFKRLAATYGTPLPTRPWPPMLTMRQVRADQAGRATDNPAETAANAFSGGADPLYDGPR